jgi:hypothetical protein
MPDFETALLNLKPIRNSLFPYPNYIRAVWKLQFPQAKHSLTPAKNRGFARLNPSLIEG